MADPLTSSAHADGRHSAPVAAKRSPRPSRRVAVVFAMEQHLGHRTYYENLRAHVDEERFDARWVPVDYVADDGVLAWFPMPASLQAALAARQAVRRGIGHSSADVHVFNTQVPAVLGGRRAWSRPYITITDVTPRQYDRMAAGYGHRADHGPIGWGKHQLNRHMFAGAAWCVGWSRWVCDSFVADYGVPTERTRVIPPGVDTGVWRPGPERDDGMFRLLFVGGEFERKGGEQLLRAFASLPDDADLTVVTRSEVPRHDRVRVVDDLVPNDPRLVDLYRTSDVFVLPTLAETFGIAAAEAAASGLAIVASDVGGLPDIVEHEVTGYTLPIGDEAALGAALERLRADPELRGRMGRRGREHAERHLDAAANARRLLELVADAAGRGD